MQCGNILGAVFLSTFMGTNLDAILSGCVGHGASHAVPANVADAPVVGVGHPDDRGHGVVCSGYVVFEILLPQQIQH